MTEIQLRGFDRIDKALSRMEKSVRADALERVADKSSDDMLLDYAYDAPPAIRKGVRVRTVDKTPNRVTVAVGSRHPLVHIFEFGTQRRKTKGGAGRGRIRKIGFARRAFDTNIARWFGRAGQLLWAEVKSAGR